MQKFDLGVMYELRREDGNWNTVNVTRPFRVSAVREQWGNASATYIGATDMFHDEIEEEGDSRISQR